MSKTRVLVAEDETIARENLEHVLGRQGYSVKTVSTGAEAIAALEKEYFDLVVTDLRMPDEDGMAVLRRAKKLHQETEVLVVTGYATVDTAVEAMGMGAYHYLSKPLNLDELRMLAAKALEKSALRREVVRLREEMANRDQPVLVGESQAMKDLKKSIRQVAPVDSTVLITGETGTGKELVARSIHGLSPRAQKRFLAVNCAAFSEELLANELFGHEAGAYTGARTARKGLMETAQGGTFFLDEIGEMDPQMQVKLLRVLEERTIIRVGGAEEIPVDVRILAATNKDLAREVEAGAFRRDLFYRLNVISLHVPPLNQRGRDIPLLASFFLDKYAQSFRKNIEVLDERTLESLEDYTYPGNVRELENIIERAVVMCEGDVLEPKHLPPGMDLAAPKPRRYGEREMISLQENERRHIAWVLEQCEGNRTKAAKVLDIDRATIWRKLKRLGLEE